MIGRARSKLKAAAWLAAAALAAGCVTERPKPSPGISYSSTAQAQRASASGTPVTIPPGPVASPASAAKTNARILVQVDPLATVNYDGQVLPQVSPDGRFIAVEQGEPPTWPTILAEAAAQPPTATRIVVFDVSAAPPIEKSTVMSYASPLPPGLLLGRSCDNRGFLVEMPRQDGSRWIGRVTWVAGQLEWLVQGPDVNAHAVFTPQGHLVYTRRAVSDTRCDLVMRSNTGSESVRSGEVSYSLPVSTNERDVVYAMALGSVGLEVEAIRIVEDPPGGNNFRLGLPLARAFLGKPGDTALAYQCTASIQNAIVTGKEHDDHPVPASPLTLLHPNPNLDRMCIFDTQAETMLPLSPRSIAAIRWSESPEGGYLCTTPQGLMFTQPPVPANIQSPVRRAPDVRLDQTPYLARATANPESPVILLGPPRRDPKGRLDICRMRVVSEEKLREIEKNVKEPAR